MQEPEAIDAAAMEAMDEAPPETSVVELAVREPEPSNVRQLHHGSRMIAGTELPVVPGDHEVAAIAQMAVTIAAATTAPAALKGNPNDAFMVLLTARDVGVGLTTAIREFHVIDGKVTLSPKVKLAMVRQQGAGKVYPHQAPRQVLVDGEWVTKRCPCGEEGPANSDTEATWHAERADEPGILHTSRFTIEMAQRVKAKEGGAKITLADKSTWKQYPQRMLSWRALGYLLDDVFSEVGTGLYSPDEMGAVTDDDGVPVIDVVGHAEPVRGTNAPRGHNQPPPPPPEPASMEDMTELSERIAALGNVPKARAALIALWTAKREDTDVPALPKLPDLLASQVSKAKAMVLSVEQRVERGEFATDDDGGPAADAVEPPPDSEVDPAAEPAPDAADGDTAAGSLLDQMLAAVAKMDRTEVVAELKERKLKASGATWEMQERLADAIRAEWPDETDPHEQLATEPQQEFVEGEHGF